MSKEIQKSDVSVHCDTYLHDYQIIHKNVTFPKENALSKIHIQNSYSRRLIIGTPDNTNSEYIELKSVPLGLTPF